MAASDTHAWKCQVCGYVHRGPEPPAQCPVCGAAQSDFEPFVEPQPAPGIVPTQWRCLNCSYITSAAAPPAACPVCHAPQDQFEPVGVTTPSVADAGKGERIVVIGAGIAGLSAAEAARNSAPEAEVILLSGEPHLPYYRLNLTRFIAGEISLNDLPIHPLDWYSAQKIELQLGCDVKSIRPEQQTIQTADTKDIRFTRLVLAGGAHAFVPPFPGVEKTGMISVRSVDDAKQLIDAITPGMQCVCIGGGILGLETAAGLVRRGAAVTVLEGAKWLLPRQLNEDAGLLLEQFAADIGIIMLKNVKVESIIGDEHVHAVSFADGRTVPADLVVITTGIRPNSCLARSAGLRVNQGVVVDDLLQTSSTNIFAAGDVAEHRGVVYGTWSPAQYEGSIAGMNAVGAGIEFGGIPRANTLKVLGLDLFSIGVVTAEDASYLEIAEQRELNYFRFLFRDTHLVGAILMGDTSASTSVKHAIESKTDFSGLLSRRPSIKDILDNLQK